MSNRSPWLSPAALAGAAALGGLVLAVVASASGAPAAPSPPPPRLPIEGGLSFDVRDAATGEAIPCKLTLVGVDGTPDPAFTRVDIARPESEGTIAAFNRLMSLTGVG